MSSSALFKVFWVELIETELWLTKPDYHEKNQPKLAKMETQIERTIMQRWMEALPDRWTNFWQEIWAFVLAEKTTEFRAGEIYE